MTSTTQNPGTHDEAQDPRITEALTEARRRGESALQVAAFLDGELIVDAVAGEVRPGELVTRSSLFPVFSVTKAVTSTALHLQAERGLVDYDAPVAAYWPKFGACGKDRMTVRQVLSHQGGIPWMPVGVTPELQADWAWMIQSIENMPPAFEPGNTNCYHSLVFGWIVAEIVRRTDGSGRGFDRFVAEEIFAPLGVDDAHFGLAPRHDDRVVPLLGGLVPTGGGPEFLLGMPPAVYPGSVAYNTEVVRRTVNPGAGIIATAVSVARFFTVLAGKGAVDGVRLLSAERVESLLRPRENFEQTDIFLGQPGRLSWGGYWLGGPQPAGFPVLGDNTAIIHHPGAGGALGWAETDTRLAVAINHNQMDAGDPTAGPEEASFHPIVQAVREIAADHRAAKGGPA